MKSLSPKQNFVTAISHAKSNQFEFVRFVVGTNSVAETKIFTKNSPIHMRQFVAATIRSSTQIWVVRGCSSDVVCVVKCPLFSQAMNYDVSQLLFC